MNKIYLLIFLTTIVIGYVMFSSLKPIKHIFRNHWNLEAPIELGCLRIILTALITIIFAIILSFL